MSQIKSILAVDDFYLNLASLKEVLGTQYNLYTAKSGRTALEILKNVSVDLFLIDIEMPDINGFDLIAMVRKLPMYAQTPIMIISSNCRTSTIERSLQYNVTDYIAKPFDRKSLLQKVKDAFENHEKNMLKQQAASMPSLMDFYIEGQV